MGAFGDIPVGYLGEQMDGWMEKKKKKKKPLEGGKKDQKIPLDAYLK
jgi:hypothetical protein